MSDFALSIGGSVTATCVVALLIWCWAIAFSRLASAVRALYALVTRRSFVLFWTDNGPHHTKKLIRAVRPELGDRLRFCVLAKPELLRRYPLTSRCTTAVVLVDTDVTKLASDNATAEKIEAKLQRFVDRGGALIGTHDVLWRRVRAQTLQETFGGRLVRYDSYTDRAVPYTISDRYKDHPLRSGLPDQFELLDDEICHGEWQPDAMCIYCTPEPNSTPLVVAREYSDGRVVWLNSGDMGEHGLCRSVSVPEEGFVKLVTNAIRWAGRQT